jgi:anti-anti-sigma regulatory factor
MPSIPFSPALATHRDGRPSCGLPGSVRARLRCLARELAPGIIEVALAGNLDVTTALKAARALRAAQAETDVVVVDLRGVHLVGRTVARVVLMAKARADRGGGRLVVVASPVPEARQFGLARVHRQLEIVDQWSTLIDQGEPA